MKISKSINDSPTKGGKLRNFDLSVEEIRILKAIKDMTRTLEDIERKNPSSDRLEYFRCEIRQLEDQLEEVRENTLIR
jgi:hypothetical protein